MSTQTNTKEWEKIKFTKCIEKVKIGRDKQVKTKDYLHEGEFPIVDQGQSFIAGFTNEKSRVINGVQPFIVFGDHTRILKFIDFPIALGADGTKVIKPNTDFDPKFFYFYLLSFNIPSRGYNRHYTILKEKTILRPPLSEQKAMAQILTIIQNAIASQNELIIKLKELKKNMMHQLFTKGTKGEKTKMTEIGEVPESWDVVKLGDICKLEYGKGLPKNKRFPGEFPVYGSNGVVGYHNVPHIDGQGIIIGRKGSAGLVHFSKESFYPIDTTFYISEKETDQNIKFIYYLLKKTDLTRLKADVGVPGVNREMAYREMVAYPGDINEQKNISEILDLIQIKIGLSQDKSSSYQNLFNTLLHKLMSGERRIK